MIFISILLFIMAIAIPSLKVQISPLLLSRITTITLLYSGVLAFNAFYIQSIGSGIGIYSGLFHISTVSQLLDTFILCVGALILIPRPYIKWSGTLSNNYTLESESILGMKYSLIILFSTLGSILLISSADLLSMYLSIELQSFGVYILATLFRDSKLASSAGLKYFLLGGLSSALILLGSALVYSYTGLTNLDSIYLLTSVSNSKNISDGLVLGIAIIIIGYLFKISAAPLHNWAPDVYDDSPTIVTIWLTIMPKISILMFLLDLYLGSTINNNTILSNLLLISSLLSLIIGTVVGLAQNRIKRLLAYSTISHIGFILLALAISSEQSIESFIFYVLVYTITNLNTFLIILALGYLIKNNLQINSFNIEKSDIRFISELKGQFNNHPLLSISLAICLFSMAGIPPLIGFFSKQMVLYSAIGNGYLFMSILGILTSVISASYYLRIIRILFTIDTNTSTPITINNSNDATIISSLHSFLISTLTLIILLFILKPSIILNSTQLLSLSIFNC